MERGSPFVKDTPLGSFVLGFIPRLSIAFTMRAEILKDHRLCHSERAVGKFANETAP
jgi:hypothetical protein